MSEAPMVRRRFPATPPPRAARAWMLAAVVAAVALPSAAQSPPPERSPGLSIPNPMSRLFPKRDPVPGPAAVKPRPAPPDAATALREWPADSLPEVLRAIESGAASGTEAAATAMTLGRLRYLRGEFREAASAFSRAAARLEPARKAEARYWTGLAWLGAHEPGQARAVLEEVARTPSPWQGPALAALGAAWEASERPERARTMFEQALAAGAWDRTPYVLERLAAYRLLEGEAREARAAEERLVKDWPRSVEAAAARARLAAIAPVAGGGGQAVAIGTYLDLARATALANGAKRAGFPDARVVSRGEGLAAVHQVWLGTYPDRGRAQQAGEQAERALGVRWEIVPAR